ncbi:TPA: LPXTG cell wall anchor domain-containing protein [Enterococcus faecalis]|uniref:LPXTG cell wall anchor domain-containing protein n=1 Tax=Enterococcus faecalis TaxID=1351 RepID=UPI001EE47A08|nr:LPXTG cell wall anchor domain-containing protein [Enterococcus faecalis]EHB5081919.1 LPXTG cell wall anchor domain-containing protein [Enterococcus faecalis]EKK5287621.1 LPXTG cell wall anchor domain-containing protein [Enterococcus faecalis]MDK7897383.1 LPXTG cell wall anchor domain-containing protein [Enterococcus faecalis]UKU96303.1 LPXTG cell wall anchor domain-containing protein [Enterococcus faecalis]UKU98998.1 LPXTG cell wall anchor domain-containing protein [Enterococcus faecalis]
MARATPANKTHGLQQLSFTKQKAQPKVQALIRAEYRNMKQAEKTSESLPHTGEQQSTWLTIMGAGTISFKKT